MRQYTYHEIHALVTKAYLQARLHERSTLAQIDFEMNQERNINHLTAILYNRSWKPSPLDWFVLTEPSIREVFAPQFRDRVVSHILFDLISPIFERHFIFDTYSCREGKGTLMGIERFEHHIRSVTNNYTRPGYCLNIDISGYFMSIVRERLYEIAWVTLDKHRKRFPDEIDYDFADFLMQRFLFRDPLEGCTYHGNPNLKELVRPEKSLFGQKPGVGLPIGDVINQLNSNIYLSVFDHFVKRVLKIKGYDRYVDDARLLHSDYRYLESCISRCAEFLERELCLKLHPNKTTITDLYDTTFFLGAAILPHRRYANNKAMTRFRNFIREAESAMDAGVPVDMMHIYAVLNSRLGYLQHFDEYKMTEKILSKAPHINEIFEFTPRYTKATFKQS